jgi:hypothetical protein
MQMKPEHYAAGDASVNPTVDWTTRIDPELSRPYGVEEVHNVWYMPDDGRPGIGATTVSLLIPELRLQVVTVLPDGEPICFIDRPRDQNVKRRLRNACAIAVDQKACLSIGADTAEQAELAARRAAKWLPKTYQRVALERLADPATRTGAC